MLPLHHWYAPQKVSCMWSSPRTWRVSFANWQWSGNASAQWSWAEYEPELTLLSPKRWTSGFVGQWEKLISTSRMVLPLGVTNIECDQIINTVFKLSSTKYFFPFSKNNSPRMVKLLFFPKYLFLKGINAGCQLELSTFSRNVLCLFRYVFFISFCVCLINFVCMFKKKKNVCMYARMYVCLYVWCIYVCV